MIQVDVALGARTYPILIEDGALDRAWHKAQAG
jgi:hypothetical protein